MVLRVKPTPTPFPSKSLYPDGQHTLAVYIECVCHPWAWEYSSYEQTSRSKPAANRATIKVRHTDEVSISPKRVYPLTMGHSYTSYL